MTTESRRAAGRYEIQRLLGSGGMASVHLAWQPALSRQVALKELHSVHVSDAGLARRFLNESRMAGALSHPSIVSVIEYFEHDGVPFIAMEYLERGSLRPLVGRLTPAQVAGVLESVLGGLAEAASQGIVHRDLKPENVLITADGHAKVADFGIAKAIGQVALTEFHTATGQVIGTPAYMAPEQATGGEITPQADLYAVGLIAYELLAGRHPFHDCDAPLALLMRHVSGPTPSLADVRPDLPAGLLAWVDSMLAKDPAARPAGAARAWDELDGVVCDALGPRWRKDAALPDPAALTPAPAEPIDRSATKDTGFVSAVIHPVTAPPAPAEGSRAVPEQAVASRAVPEPAVARRPVSEPAEAETLVLAAPARRPVSEPAVARRAVPEPAEAETLVLAAPARRSGRRVRAPALAAVALFLPLVLAALVLALVASHDSGAAPPASRAAVAGPAPAELLRDAVAPAVRAGARLSDALSSLTAGSSAGEALDRAGAALTATGSALSAVRALPASDRVLHDRALRALRTQHEYLEHVRDSLRLRTVDPQLDGIAARLVSRLARIEPVVPHAADSVHGARELDAWAIAQVPGRAPAATATPTPTPTATTTPAPTPTATPTATPTPTTTPTPTPIASNEQPPAAQRPGIRLRRAIRRKLLETAAEARGSASNVPTIVSAP